MGNQSGGRFKLRGACKGQGGTGLGRKRSIPSRRESVPVLPGKEAVPSLVGLQREAGIPDRGDATAD